MKRRGRHYVVTCSHVLQTVTQRKEEAGEAQLSMARHVDRAVLDLSSVGPEGIVLSVRPPEADLHSKQVDIAMASLEPSFGKF